MSLIVVDLVVVALVITGVILWRKDRRLREEHPNILYQGLLSCFLLVLLRLAIGWHFVFEGAEKVQSPTWTSEPYLREASGPLAPTFRWMAGDPLYDRLHVAGLEPGQDPTQVPSHKRFPPLLERDWKLYYDRFADYYQIDDTQRHEAETRFLQNKDQTALWLIQGVKKVKRESPYGPPVEVDLTTPQRIQEYAKKVEEANKLQEQSLKMFGPDVTVQLRTAKADVNRLRADLRRDLDEQNAAMKKALRDVLRPDQVKKGVREVLGRQMMELPEIRQAEITKVLDSDQKVEDLNKSLAAVLRPEQLTVDPLEGKARPALRQMTRLERIDWITKWGLLAVGFCLLAGLFTRTACVAGAGFLLLFYLAMPSLPGLPENPKAEGHYFLINKNIIEMLALLALATTRSGRWLGIDGLLQFLNPRRWRSDNATRGLAVVPAKPQVGQAVLVPASEEASPRS